MQYAAAMPAFLISLRMRRSKLVNSLEKTPKNQNLEESKWCWTLRCSIPCLLSGSQGTTTLSWMMLLGHGRATKLMSTPMSGIFLLSNAPSFAIPLHGECWMRFQEWPRHYPHYISLYRSSRSDTVSGELPSESFVRCDGIQLKSTSFPERIHWQRHWYLLSTHPLKTAFHVKIHNSCLFFPRISGLTYCCGWESHVAEAQRHQSEYNVYMSRPINPNLEGIAPDRPPVPFSQFEQVQRKGLPALIFETPATKQRETGRP